MKEKAGVGSMVYGSEVCDILAGHNPDSLTCVGCSCEVRIVEPQAQRARGQELTSRLRRAYGYLVRLIREAIAKVPIEMGAPSVLLNPADRSLISNLAPEIEDDGIVLLDDDSIEPGGCVVIANGDDAPLKDRRWHPRAGEGVSQVNLTLSSRWRSVMLTLFDGEEL